MQIRIPEVNLLVFSFLLNLLWETIQAPLFVFDQQFSTFLLTGCLLFCSGVDALMTLTSYWIVSITAGSRYWFLSKSAGYWISFVGVGLILAFVSEYTAVHYRDLWQYTERMPIVPGLDVGLTPILQWLILPPLVLILLTRACGLMTENSFRKVDADWKSV